MKTFTAFALLATVLMVGCAQEAPYVPTTDFLPQEPLLPIEENLSVAETRCADKSSCPESVGYVLSTVPQGPVTGLIQCTGFLVAPDIIATNSHCIPKELKKPGADCADRIGIKFPKTSKQDEESFYCEKILLASKIAEKDEEGFIEHADYAFFKLTKATSRRTLQLSRRGLPEGEELVLFTMTPMSEKKPEGQLSRKLCRPVKGTQFMPADSDAFSEVAIAFGEDCDAKGGNSGSPVLGPSGKVVGLLHGGIAPDIDLNAEVPSESRSEELERPVYLTNLACVEFAPGLGSLGPRPPECDPQARQKAKADFEAHNKKKAESEINDSLQAAYRDWARTAPSIVRLKASVELKEADGLMTAVFSATPRCALPRASWAVDDGHAAWSESHAAAPDHAFSQAIAATEFEMPHFRQQPVYDRYLRAKMTMKVIAKQRVRLEFDWTKLTPLPDIVGTTTLFIGENDSVEVPLALRSCAQDELAHDEPLSFAAP